MQPNIYFRGCLRGRVGSELRANHAAFREAFAASTIFWDFDTLAVIDRDPKPTYRFAN